MWVPKTLKITNFISHLKSEFTFNTGQSVLIQGINEDDDCQESNGSGKSAIIEGTIFALTGDSFRKVRTVDLIMNDKDFLETTIYLENTLSNDQLIIMRSTPRNKSTTVEVYLNGEQKVLSSVNEYNKFILEILDISKEDLMNYFIVSKEKYQSFLLTTDSKKKEIISRFSNSNLIDGVDKIVESDVNILNSDIQKSELRKSKLEGQIEVYQEQLSNQNTKENFENDKKRRIDLINDKIESLLNNIVNNDKTIESNSEMLLKTQEKLNKFSVSDLKAKLTAADENESKIRKIGSELKNTASEYEQLIAEINKNLAGSVECPKCEHEFVVSNPDFDVNEAKQTVDVLLKELETVKKEIVEKREEYKTAETLKSEISNEIRKVERLQHEVKMQIKNLENEISNAEKNNLMYAQHIKQNEEQIKSIEDTKFTSNEKEVKDKIKTATKEIKNIEKSISEIESNKIKLVEWVYNFKKFKTHLTNKSIKSIESFTNLYLTKIKTNLAVKMEGYKLLADGKTIRENITVDMLRNGLLEGPIDKFSGGEKVRVDICNILALQKLINLNSKSGGLDLLLLDEIIESVDSVGVSEILKQLNAINQTIAIITHANTVRDFSNIITVVKKDGYSKVI